MTSKPWWYRMAEMRSFIIVVTMFTRYWRKYKDYRAVVRTAKEYPHADIHMTSLMLENLGIINVFRDDVTYDLERLADVTEYMVEHG
jgi:hypothetical protein